MYHFDPRLRGGHWTFGHGVGSSLDVLRRANGRDITVATRPVRTSQSRVSQPHESAKHDEIQREKPRQENQAAIPLQSKVAHVLLTNPRVAEQFAKFVANFAWICILRILDEEVTERIDHPEKIVETFVNRVFTILGI